MLKVLQNKIFDVDSKGFEKLAFEIFMYQYLNNKIYGDYVNNLKIDIKKINSLQKIPFLPIDLFKNRKIVCDNNRIEKIFKSSGTSGLTTSLHYLSSLKLYIESFTRCFNLFYGNIYDYCIIGLLPSYLERKNSSLVYMVEHLIKKTKNESSGFYLKNYNELVDTLKYLESKKQKTIVFGVSYALLDLAEIIDIKLKYTIIIETGGMKGRRKELPKHELHSILQKGFGLKNIHSEYGMTELLSQAYSKSEGIFYCPPWMKIFIRDTFDPFSYKSVGASGGINIIDLANINSCSFIESKDLGKLHNDDSFHILGRYDSSDIRGCNLMVE